MRDNEYTSQQPGFKLVFVALVVAAIMGLSFRLYFSAQRMKSLIEQELARRPSPVAIQFKTAEFSLARGMIPQIAIRLVEVEGRSVKSCAKVPGFKISELFIPFRPLALIRGKISIGVIHSEKLEIDLDAMKDRCNESEVAEQLPSEPARPVQNREGSSPASAKSIGEVRPWWSAEQWEKVTQLVSGVSFDQLTLKFEHGEKSIVLEDVLLRADIEPQTLSLVSDVLVPPNLLFGQQLPPFSVEVTAKADSADIKINGNIGEGAMEGLATIKAIPGDVHIDSHLNLSQVPLSAVMAYFHENNKLSKDIKPRFLWVNCEANIAGAAQGLFKDNPLTLERCALEGDGATMVVEKAVIGPGDKLEPFKVNIGRIDVKKMFAMLKRDGPSGVMQQFGHLAGEVTVNGLNDFAFKGRLEAASFIFSQQAVRVVQPVPELAGQASYRDGKWDVTIDGAKIVGGHFEGSANLKFDKDRAGSFDLSIKQLAFHKDVQRLVLRGLIDNLALNGKGSFEGGKFKDFRGRIEMNKLLGSDFEAPDAHMNIKVEGTKATGNVIATTARMRKDSRLHEIFKPILFGHKFREDWISLRDFSSEFKLENRLFSWTKATVIVPEAILKIRSSGTLNDSDQIEATVDAEYPRYKNLRWQASGSLFAPKFTPDGNTKSAVDSYTSAQ